MKDEANQFFYAMLFEVSVQIKFFFNRFKQPCIQKLMSDYDCDKSTAEQLYISAFSTVYEQILFEKLKGFTGSPVSYLITIAKNTLLEHKRKHGRVDFQASDELFDNLFDHHMDRELLEERLEVLKKALDILGNPCKEVLMAKYGHRHSQLAIAEDHDYSSAASVGNTTSRCKERLGNIIDDLTKSK